MAGRVRSPTSLREARRKTHLEADVEVETVARDRHLAARLGALDALKANIGRLDPHCAVKSTAARQSPHESGTGSGPRTEEGGDDADEDEHDEDQSAAEDAAEAARASAASERAGVLVLAEHAQPLLLGDRALGGELRA